MLKPLRNATGLPSRPLPAARVARPKAGGDVADAVPDPSFPWFRSSLHSPLALSPLALFLLALSILPAVAPGSARAEVRRYEVGADEMTRQAADHFPVRRCLLEVACVTLSEPKVRLLDGDPRIHLTTTVRPELGGERLDSGEVDLAGTPYYAPDRGAFFLKGARITESRFPGLNPQQARTVSELASSLLAGALRKEPIYKLDEGDARQALARLVLRDVRVSKGRLLLVVGDDEP